MEFDNQFTVQAPLDEVWDFMLNVQEVAPCVPGAQITEVIDDTHYRGTTKIKVGPVQMTYRGELEMIPNREAHTIILRAKGTETRGGGGASGAVTTTLSDAEGGGTTVSIHSRVDVSGRAAQFGRGLMQDVSNKLIKDFARCLEQKLQPGQGSATGQNAVPAYSPQSAAQSPANQTPSPDSAVTETPSGEGVPAPILSPTESMRPEPEPQRATVPAPVTVARPPTTTFDETSSASELSISGLLMDIARSRLARALRDIADRLEP